MGNITYQRYQKIWKKENFVIVSSGAIALGQKYLKINKKKLN
jgi:glutamate 5-kinase